MQKVFKLQEEYHKKVNECEKEINELIKKRSAIESKIADLEKRQEEAIVNKDVAEYKKLNDELKGLIEDRTFYNLMIDKSKKSTGLNPNEVKQMVGGIYDACIKSYKELCMAYIEHAKIITEIVMPSIRELNEAAVFAGEISDKNNLPKFPPNLDFINLYGKCVALQNEINNMSHYVKQNLEDK